VEEMKKAADYRTTDNRLRTTDHGTEGEARKSCETLKTASRPKRPDASAVADLGCRGGLAGKALPLRVFAPLLYISAPPVPLMWRARCPRGRAELR
jgi:hypothetical protein